jgi:hypothetical protein
MTLDDSVALRTAVWLLWTKDRVSQIITYMLNAWGT